MAVLGSWWCFSEKEENQLISNYVILETTWKVNEKHLSKDFPRAL
jgi:hypothetical protein